ncbi:MAG: 6-bladed beta-propeller, partial [Tannerellaceae bacterium]|nr:6-bladed beta-propeller [Tannerellaceae bacterium]
MKNATAILATILFVTAGFAGCKPSGATNDDLITVDVTANYPKKELILQDCFDVEYVPLETTDEFITRANIQTISK